MISFLNKDIDVTNKTKEEIQESLLTKKQFDSKAKIQTNFSPHQLSDDNNNNIYIYLLLRL